MKTNVYIELLPDTLRQLIYRDLLELGLSNEDIDIAMSSRLCDLSDILDNNKYIK